MIYKTKSNSIPFIFEILSNNITNKKQAKYIDLSHIFKNTRLSGLYIYDKYKNENNTFTIIRYKIKKLKY